MTCRVLCTCTVKIQNSSKSIKFQSTRVWLHDCRLNWFTLLQRNVWRIVSMFSNAWCFPMRVHILPSHDLLFPFLPESKCYHPPDCFRDFQNHTINEQLQSNNFHAQLSSRNLHRRDCFNGFGLLGSFTKPAPKYSKLNS